MEQGNPSVKNYQTHDVIKQMYKKVFNKSIGDITISKLSGGMKNAVYLVESDNNKVVLKIGPSDETKMISADRNIMWWEAKMLELMDDLQMPAPKLLYFENDSEFCHSPYIFMTYVSGKNFLKEKEKLSKEELSDIEYQLGLLSLKICSIKSNKFFLPSQLNATFNNNYEFISNLFNMLLIDAKENNIDLSPNGYSKIRTIIETHRDSLNNITNLCLSHTDIWDGNVLVDSGNVVGIVDFSDLYFCDELLTFYFHTVDGKTSEDFLRGFGNKSLNNDEKIRIEIYRMYVILKMIIDCQLKQYGKFEWMYSNLSSIVNSFQKKM